MEKRASRLLYVLLITLLALTLFSSCDGFFAYDAGQSGEQGLIYDSDTELSFIIDPALRGETVMSLWDRIGLLADISPKILDDSSEQSEHEIVIGRVDRPIAIEAYTELMKINAEDGKLRYLIYSDGSSVAIAFDDDDYGYAMRAAVGCFIDNYVSSKLVMKEGVAASEVISLLDESTAALGAGFESMKNGALPTVSGERTESDGYYLFSEKTLDTTGAIVIDDPTGKGGKVLKYYTDESGFSEGVKISAAETPGAWTVLELDFFVESAVGETSLRFDLGTYGIKFNVYGECFKIYDVNSVLQSGYLDSFLRFSEWHNMKIVAINREISDKAARAYVFLDGVCVAESYNVSEEAFLDYAYLTTDKSEGITVYYDNVAYYRTGVDSAEETAFLPKRVFTERETVSIDAYQNADILLDSDAAMALREMDAGLFSADIYRWIADLYDPETSALYFSISGRDNYGYLPDIETVAQGYGILSTLGIGGATSVLNAEQKASLLAWVQMMQSNRDGYFYHPHWGVSINSSRRSRDYGNSGSSFTASGALAYRLYDDANYRLSAGKSGTVGVVTPQTYSEQLTSALGYPMAEAVSRLVLASGSSMPAHFSSEAAFVNYLNKTWNQTCGVAGVHERHICSDSCHIVPSDIGSYMTVADGKLVITRGYECTSHHECEHTVGHSYSYGHTMTSQGSQIKAAGLGEAIVAYFYDIQENVQASLRDKADAVYMTKAGFDIYRTLDEYDAVGMDYDEKVWQTLSDSKRDEAVKYTYILEKTLDAYDALSAKDRADIDWDNYVYEKGVSAWSKLAAGQRDIVISDYDRVEKAKKLVFLGAPEWLALDEPDRDAVIKSSQNGIWEEEITYNTVSGLLKICGIPGTHGHEFLYAEEAIGTAIRVALFSVEDFVLKGEAIVSIYNPFNAISGIMGNVQKYGSDPSVVDRTYARTRAIAKELIENTAKKVETYRMPDGGYSYNMGGYCTHSQGQPVAINGYVPSYRLPSFEGIVESGEGDVNGTALALGTRSALLGSLGISIGAPFSGSNALYSEDGYDLDCDGNISEDELLATHTDVFKSLIQHKAPIVKVDNTKVGGTVNDFEDGIKPSSGTIIREPGNTDNKILSVTDNSSTSGISVSFIPSLVSGEEDLVRFKFDMKLAEAHTHGVTHQIFVNGGGVLTVNMNLNENGYFESFVNSNSGEVLKDEYGRQISVNGKEWFTLCLEILETPVIVNGVERAARMTVSQYGESCVGYFTSLKSEAEVTSCAVYSLNGSLNTFYLDNVALHASRVSGVEDGYYHFNTAAQKHIFEDGAMSSPLDENDVLYSLSDGETLLDAYYYSTSSVIYSFNSLQADILLSDMTSGERLSVYFTDSGGARITGISLLVNPDGSVSFLSPTGTLLKAAMRSSGVVIDKNMLLNVDRSRFITLKLEYHHDMAEPQLDLVVKYADAEKDGYYAIAAATLTGVPVLDTGADAGDFESLCIEYDSLGGKAYVDDLFIRNVLTP